MVSHPRLGLDAMKYALLACGLLLLPTGLYASVSSSAASQARPGAEETYQQLDRFVEIFEKIRASYVDRTSDAKLMRGAIDGMLASLDPHSAYLDESGLKQMNQATDGRYGGIGVTVGSRAGQLQVIKVNEGGPAARAGVRTDDVITAIDGKALAGSATLEVSDALQGKPGTPVRISIERNGVQHPIDMQLTRAVISLKTVSWRMQDHVGVITISGFARETGAETRAAIKAIEARSHDTPTGFLIDLRGNPGGLVDQAIEVANSFLDHGEIVSQRGREKADIERYYATAGDDTKGAPIALLIDHGTASAAEIVAGALQDQKRAIVFGTRSFGKGSVQELMPLSGDTALKLTIARYYTPSGRSVQEEGIQPDIVVPQTVDDLTRKQLSEADLKNHLTNVGKDAESQLLIDDKPDPRFSRQVATASDYQLDYVVRTMARLKS
jgi:carboxyl-terminal processing protease